jgi:Do/DeqQ family serine protease
MNEQSSKQNSFFLFNLIFFSLLVGFTLGFFGISCSSNAEGLSTVNAQETLSANELAAVNDLQNAFRKVSETVLPGVVKVSVVDVTTRRTAPFGNNPFRFFFEEEEGQEPQEREFRSEGLGSGFIVKLDGNTAYVMTNDHVAGDAEEIELLLPDGRTFEGELVGTDPRKDLALLRFDTKGEPVTLVRLGDSDSLRVGDWVLAMGNPLGLEFSVTAGIVSALGRQGGPSGNISDFIQTDASINQGNSGGPLVNIYGEVVGINTWIASPSGGNVGLGFSVPINNAKKAIDDFIRTGEVEYGWLGVSIGEADEITAEALSIQDQKGAFVFHVFKDSPAYKAGLRPGDLVTSIDGQTVRNSNELTVKVGDIPPGRTVDFDIIRLGESSTLRTTIEKRDTQEAIDAQSQGLWPGFNVQPLNDRVREALELEDGLEGLVIAFVLEDTKAKMAGLQVGDRILRINDRQVNDLKDYYAALGSNASETKITFIRDDAELSITIKN